MLTILPILISIKKEMLTVLPVLIPIIKEMLTVLVVLLSKKKNISNSNTSCTTYKEMLTVLPDLPFI